MNGIVEPDNKFESGDIVYITNVRGRPIGTITEIDINTQYVLGVTIIRYIYTVNCKKKDYLRYEYDLKLKGNK